MSIRIVFFTLLIKAAALDARFPGGRVGFLATYPEAPHDEMLFALRAMSGGDLGLLVDQLEAYGLRLGRDIAIGELVHGEWEPAPGIVFLGEAWHWRAEMQPPDLPEKIFDLHESGATDSWCWEAWLSKHADGSYSLQLRQEPWEADPDAEPSSYELEHFHSGGELFTFMQDAWITEHEEHLDEQAWAEIADNLGPIDGTLADEVRAAVMGEFHPPEDDASSMPATPLQRCIAGATWQRTIREGGGGAMWAGIAEARRDKQAVALYARRYLEKHQELPQGVHQVRVTFGPAGSGADCAPGGWSGGSAVFDKAVWYPELD
jgi:hypothetical protein